MGGGDDSNAQDQSDELMNKEYQQNQADIQQKRQTLFETSLAIQKSAGGSNWLAQRPGMVTTQNKKSDANRYKYGF